MVNGGTMTLVLKTKPYKHQIEALRRTAGKEYFGLLMQQGTGKTWVTLARALHEWNQGRIDSLVVVAPKGVYLNWRKEILVHMPDGVCDIVNWSSYKTADVIRGLKGHLEPLPQDFKQTPFSRFARKLRVLLINVEALSTKKVQTKRLRDKDKLTAYEYLQEYLLVNRSLMVVDESTTIKDRNSRRTKQLIELRSNAPYRMVLSGMPVPKAPTDIYTQCLFLKRGAIPYLSFKAFEQEFVLKKTVRFGNRSFPQVVGYQNLDMLQEHIAPFTYRVTKKQCLDLPDKIYQVRDIELTDEQRKAYNELAKTFRTEAENGLVTTEIHAMTRVMRLHQIVAGHLVADEEDGKRIITDLKSNRIDDMMEVLEQHEGQAIVWAIYRHDFAKIKERLLKEGLRLGEYHGAISDQDRESADTLFQAGKLDVMLANPAVAARGRTWTKGSLAIYYTNAYNFEYREQSEDRNHRIGTEESPLYVDLLARGTVDERIVLNLKEKKRTGGRLMGDDPSEFIDWFKDVT
jgi:SNF2 family DNA or RNA helicase